MPLSRLLFLIYMGGLLGVLAELLLLEHFEDWQQWVPLVLLGIGAWAGIHAAMRPAGGARFLKVTLALMAVSGVVGQILHFRGNWEFEVESDATLPLGRLLVDSLMGATPTLAPGTMTLLAAVGYAWMRSRAGE